MILLGAALEIHVVFLLENKPAGVRWVWWCGVSSSVLEWVMNFHSCHAGGCPLESCLSEPCTQEHAPAFSSHTSASEKGWDRGLLQPYGGWKVIVLAEELQKCGDYCCQLLLHAGVGPRCRGRVWGHMARGSWSSSCTDPDLGAVS